MKWRYVGGKYKHFKTANTRYFLFCVVVPSVVQDEEVIEWSEVSTLIWSIQPRLWFTLW
jgi:hypothetical protein